MGCCSSKKQGNRASTYASDLNDNEIEEEEQVKGSIEWKYKDELMDQYIKEKFVNVQFNKEKDSTGLLQFESFLKIYRATLIWTRVKFTRKQDEFLA